MSGDAMTKGQGIVSKHHGGVSTEEMKLDARRERHREVYLKLKEFFSPKEMGFSFSFDGKKHKLVVSARVAEMFGWTASQFYFDEPEAALPLIATQA